MARKRKPEEIIGNLREAEIVLRRQNERLRAVSLNQECHVRRPS